MRGGGRSVRCPPSNATRAGSPPGSRRRRCPGWTRPRRTARTSRRADLDGNGVVPRLDALDGRAVGAPGEPLGLEPGLALREAEVDAELDGGARVDPEVLRHGAADTEPGGPPGPTTPGLADGERRVLGGDGLGERHRFVRHLPGVDGDRGRATVHGGVDAVADEAGDPSLDEGFVVVHGGGSFPAGTVRQQDGRRQGRSGAGGPESVGRGQPLMPPARALPPPRPRDTST